MQIRWVIALLALALPVLGQMQDNTQPSLACQDGGSHGASIRHCEMREQTVAYAGQLAVDAGENGGVSVRGWSRADVLVRSRVEAWAATDEQARALAAQVLVNTAAGRVNASGPAAENDRTWSVSYEVFAPHGANVQAATHNGGVHLSDIRGQVEFSAVNGGVHLVRMGGRVQGHTTNGGVHIELEGTRWDGEGVDVATTNGGVHVAVPANYSARLETSTVNGGIQNEYPMTVTGKIGKQLSAKLGAGGATIRVVTTNGGVRIAPM
jgi:DUF4097 and DUF4098 domain-containing protein YvlB